MPYYPLLNNLFEIIYYIVFIGLGLFMIVTRDAWISKLVESQKMSDFIFKKGGVSEKDEYIYAACLIIGIGLVFIAFGFFKILKG